MNTSRKIQRQQEAEVVGLYRRLVPCDAASTGRHLVQIGYDAEGNIRHLRSDCALAASDAVVRLGGKACGDLAAKIRLQVKTGVIGRYSASGAKVIDHEITKVDHALQEGVIEASSHAGERRAGRQEIARQPGPEAWRGSDWRDTLLKRLVLSVLGPGFDSAYLQSSFTTKALGFSTSGDYDYVSGGRKQTLVPLLSYGSAGAWYVSVAAARTAAKHFGRKSHDCVVCNKHYPGIGNHLNGGIHADKVIARLKVAAQRLTKMSLVSRNLLDPAPAPVYALGVQYVRGAA